MLFALHAIDKPASLEVRKANRENHLAYLANFEIAVAGPLLNDAGEMAGSCILVELPDMDAAQKFANNDPYARAGLFANVEIHEFKKAIWPQ